MKYFESNGNPVEATKGAHMVYDLETVRHKVRELRDYLSQIPLVSKVFYAAKACYIPEVVEALITEGCGLEIMSREEHGIARHFRLTSDKVIWNVPGLDVDTVIEIVQGGEWINIDNPVQFVALQRLAFERGTTVKTGVRINMEGSGRFGITLDELGELLSKSRSSVQITGFHLHLHKDKNRKTEDRLLRAEFVKEAFKFASHYGLELDYLDIGGGFHRDRSFAEQLDPAVEEMLSSGYESTMLFCEPGAFVVESAGSVYANIIGIKQLQDRYWATLDVGANTLVPLERADYHSEFIERGDQGDCTLAGCTGIEGDIIEADIKGDPEVGDGVLIRNCGAYTQSIRSFFIYSPLPIIIRDQGKMALSSASRGTVENFLQWHGYE